MPDPTIRPDLPLNPGKTKGPGRRTLRYDRPCRDRRWTTAVVTVPTTSPAPVMAVEAADCVSDRLRLVPATWRRTGRHRQYLPQTLAQQRVPDVGLCDMTDPAGTVEDDCGGHRPDHESRSCDGGRWPPTACQTDYVWYRLPGAGPVDTTRFTAEPEQNGGSRTSDSAI